MSLDLVMARVAELQQMLAPAAASAPVAAPSTATTSFSDQLLNAATGATLGPGSTAAPSVVEGRPASSVGQAIVNAALPEVGVSEQPPGSNDSPRIAQFRQATAGSGVGPWCAYFASWAARQAGVPLGDNGQGFGRVDDVYAWAQRTGKAIPNGANAHPQPGDLIVWDEHIGIVQSVDPSGTIHTIEGNSSDKVSQRTYGSDGGGAVGYVRLG
jgi:CHAP domain-containing protein